VLPRGRSGLGGAVLDELVVIARERGARSLAASTTADNLAAVRALRRVGATITRGADGDVDAVAAL